jgi:hypothetical protein
VKICGGCKGREALDADLEEVVVEGTRRLGRGRIGRAAIRDAGRGEEAGEEGYCRGVWWTVVDAVAAEDMITRQKNQNDRMTNVEIGVRRDQRIN